MSEWNDVVRHGGLANNALGGAVPAERFGPQSSQTLRNCPTSPLPFSHAQRLQRETPGKPFSPGRNSHLYISEAST